VFFGLGGFWALDSSSFFVKIVGLASADQKKDYRLKEEYSQSKAFSTNPCLTGFCSI
jgi:hypothetical protein